MKKYFIIIMLIISKLCFAQNVITLETCYTLSEESFNLELQKNLKIESTELTISNLKTAYYPTLNLVGTASYQSSAIEINLPIPGLEMPQVPLDQYKIYLELSQVIYDGGATSTLKDIENISLEAETKNIEIDFQTIKEQINDVYFLILLFQKQEEIIDLLLDNLDARLLAVESAVKNGVLLSVNYDIILAEKLKVEQQLQEIQTGKTSGIKILSQLTDTVLTTDYIFEYPEIKIDMLDTTISRAEFELFDIQQTKIEKYSELTKSQRKPKVAAFAQAGYGRPGLNMLSDEFNPYFIVGATATWNLWDWNSSKRERQILQVSTEILDVQEENFEKTVLIEMNTQLAAIEKLEQQIETDEEIIELRNKIVNAYASQLQNGTITSSEYIIELNAVTEAKLNKEIHNIQLLQAKVNYLTAKGDL